MYSTAHGKEDISNRGICLGCGGGGEWWWSKYIVVIVGWERRREMQTQTQTKGDLDLCDVAQTSSVSVEKSYVFLVAFLLSSFGKSRREVSSGVSRSCVLVDGWICICVCVDRFGSGWML